MTPKEIYERIFNIKFDLISNFSYLNINNVQINEFRDCISIHINLGFGQHKEKIHEIMNFLDKYEYFDSFCGLTPCDNSSWGECFTTYVKKFEVNK